mgnify:FL=1
MKKILTSKPICLWKSNNLLGEGVVWVKEHNSIYFVDIEKKKIFILNLRSNKKDIIKVDKPIGFLAHIKKHYFILGMSDELRIINIKNNKILKSIPIEIDYPKNRINDGKVDSYGNLWFGTMDKYHIVKNGSLYCLDKKLILHKVDRNYFIPNGPCFLNGNTFFHTDSKKRIIYKMKVNKNYKLIYKKKFVSINKKKGSPDGMTIDNFQNLWICHFGGGCITVINQKGKKIHEVQIPSKNVTNCTFGGTLNRYLFVTTAKKGIRKSSQKKYNLSGSLFLIKTNVKGYKSKKYNYKL